MSVPTNMLQRNKMKKRLQRHFSEHLWVMSQEVCLVLELCYVGVFDLVVTLNTLIYALMSWFFFRVTFRNVAVSNIVCLYIWIICRLPFQRVKCIKTCNKSHILVGLKLWLFVFTMTLRGRKKNKNKTHKAHKNVRKNKIHLIWTPYFLFSWPVVVCKVDTKWIKNELKQVDQIAEGFCGGWWVWISLQCSSLSVRSCWGCRLTPGQMSFHGKNEDVWPNPLFPHIKMDISELSVGEVWFCKDSCSVLADRGLPFSIHSQSPPSTIMYSGFPMGSEPAQLWRAVHFSLSNTY